MRFRYYVCIRVKNVKLIHSKKNFQKTVLLNGTGENVYEFVLRSCVGKQHHGTSQCDGSNRLRSKKCDGLLSSEF